MRIVIVAIIVFLNIVTVKCNIQDTTISKIKEKVGSRRDGMQISIQTETDTFTLEVQSSDTIKTVKTKIQDKKGIPASEQSLFFENDELYDAYKLSDYGITEGSVITLVHEDKF